MADLTNLIHDYLAHRHFDLMPSDTKDRFDDYVKNESFIGHMKKWKELYVGQALEGLETTINGSTADADWRTLYYACQKAFQDMDITKNNPVGYGSPYNGPTKDFIAEWFGNEPGKVFTVSTANRDTEDVFSNLASWLTIHKGALEYKLTDTFKDSLFSKGYTYDKLINDLKNKRYNTDTEWRKNLISLLSHINYYQDGVDPSVFPDMSTDLFNFAIGSFKLAEPDTWYEIPDETTRIKWFKAGYANLFDKLLTNTTIRNKFLEKAPSVIREAFEAAIADTDYENKESDDYVPPDPVDEKNLRQKIKKWKNDTYENHFRRFFDHNRGARVFYSQASQNIMKGLDKAGVKPIDGLAGLIAKKDDAKLRGVVDSDGTTRKHFEWFVSTMEKISKDIPDAYEGALKNGHQLRQVASYIITIGANSGEIAKAKTALEILSVAKYGLSMSRTFDRVKEATKEMKLLNDSGYSWMKKDSPTEFIANAAEGLLGGGIRVAAGLVTLAHNSIQHRRTKIRNNISNNKHLKGEYEKWQNKDSVERSRQHDLNVAHDVVNTLTTLANSTRTFPAPAGGLQYKTAIAIDETNIGDDDTPGTIKGELHIAKTATPPATTVTIGGSAVNVDDLQNDVDLFDYAYNSQQLENDDALWREKHPDHIHDLVAYWDMLESYGKTHTFALGSMKVKRKAFLAKEANDKTKAQNQAAEWIANYGALRVA